MSGFTIAVASRSFSRHPVLRRELTDRYPDTRFNDSDRVLAGDELVAFLSGMTRAVIALEKLDAATLARLPALEVVAKFGVGVDGLDLAALAARGVRLGWTGGVNRRSVSELVTAFAIALLRHLPKAAAEIRTGGWRPEVGRQLSSRVIGIVGCGHVGKDVGRVMRAFGCEVLAHDILDFPDYYRETGIRSVGLEALLRAADVVTLHLPLYARTQGILSAARIALMREGAILINTARGGLVDEAALKTALKNGRLAGAACDVFAVEPPDDPELLALPNFLATPHMGAATEEAILAMGRAAIEGLEVAEVPRPGTPYWPI